ncbi:MAG: transcription antitermination factor NusB [Clostridia bacterium]|nr:transcription antitermination factor NusB [Clostridia bacterium]
MNKPQVRAPRKPAATVPPAPLTAEEIAAKFIILNQEDYRQLAAAPRRRAREAALALLFQIDLGGDWQHAQTVLSDIGLKKSHAAFALTLAQNADADRDSSDPLISRYSREWSLERLAAVDRCVLRLAISELLRSPAEQANIIINEAIELGKKFGDENSGAYINGVLDAIRLRDLSPAPEADPTPPRDTNT